MRRDLRDQERIHPARRNCTPSWRALSADHSRNSEGVITRRFAHAHCSSHCCRRTRLSAFRSRMLSLPRRHRSSARCRRGRRPVTRRQLRRRSRSLASVHSAGGVRPNVTRRTTTTSPSRAQPKASTALGEVGGAQPAKRASTDGCQHLAASNSEGAGAEREGLEPSAGLLLRRLAGGYLRPLGHLLRRSQSLFAIAMGPAECALPAIPGADGCLLGQLMRGDNGPRSHCSPAARDDSVTPDCSLPSSLLNGFTLPPTAVNRNA